jgi:hypothetical protein
MRLSRIDINPLPEIMIGLWLTIFIVAMALSKYANTTEINHHPDSDSKDRYPYRLPDWFWQSPKNAHLLSPQEVISTRNDIAKLDGLLNTSSAKHSLEINIAEWLASKFSIRDLIISSNVVTSPKTQLSLAVLLDPDFDPNTKAMLQDAALRFIEVAFDPVVIKKAYDRSTLMPSPMPEEYELKDGSPLVDEIDRPVYAENYAFYLTQRTKPASIEAFLLQLRNALTTPTGDPAVLMISRYSGDEWWGGGYNNFHSTPLQQLKREAPSCGYLYIKLNSDKLKKPEPNWNDTNFWASKIAHEFLHNLGYWHPNYKSPAERDANNRGNNWAFIVSYEFAIHDKLNEIERSEQADI